jgi:hypothetical protein
VPVLKIMRVAVAAGNRQGLRVSSRDLALNQSEVTLASRPETFKKNYALERNYQGFLRVAVATCGRPFAGDIM